VFVGRPLVPIALLAHVVSLAPPLCGLAIRIAQRPGAFAAK
jgi:hypothetical protein